MSGIKIVFAALALAVCCDPSVARAAETPSAPPIDHAAWQADLDQVRDALTTDYANLEWAAADRLSLKTVYERATTVLAQAKDDDAARLVLRQFVAGFGDGHLSITWPAPAPLASTVSESPAPAPTPCDVIGRGRLSDRQGTAMNAEGFQALDTPDTAVIPAGIIQAGGRRVGVLRIAGFGHRGYNEICDRAAQTLGLSTGPCDDDCNARLNTAATEAYLGMVTRQIEALAVARPDVLLVDIALNGGGDDTSEVIARMLTARSLRSAPVGMMRTAAWRTYLDGQLTELRGRRASGPRADRLLLDGLIGRIQTAREAVEVPCDRSPLWRDEPIACSQLIRGSLHATAWFDGGGPTGVEGRPWAEWVDVLARYGYRPGLWTGPLVVLVDYGTASSAEQFASELRDNGAATIVGGPTLGAGCGHWLGGDPVRLTHSGGLLSMPDCVRFRADGANEVGGLEPDILLPIRTNDSRRQRGRRLMTALPMILRAVTSRDAPA